VATPSTVGTWILIVSLRRQGGAVPSAPGATTGNQNTGCADYNYLCGGSGAPQSIQISVWKEQAHNLRQDLGTEPTHPGFDWTSPSDWADGFDGNWDSWF
jgi:hypothetical protein